MKTVTVTLNPSLDRVMIVKYLNIGYHNQAIGDTRLYAAGRGMNMARALHALQTDVTGVVVLGDDPFSKAYEKLASIGDFPVHIIRAATSIRSNLFLVDEGNNTQTVIKEDSKPAQPDTPDAVRQQLADLVDDEDYVVFPGSLAADSPDDTHATLIHAVQEAGGRAIIHTEGDYLREGLKARPHMVYLRQLQAERYFNFPVRVVDDVRYCAEKFLEEGAEYALVVMDDKNKAIMAEEGRMWLIELPPEGEDFGTRTGMLEAFIAGYLTGQVKERKMDRALELGSAAAAFAAAQVDASFAEPNDLRDHLRHVTVSRIDSE